MLKQILQGRLITGGAGFIGSRLSLCLRAAGHEVAIFDNLNRQVHRNASAIVGQLREAGVHLTPDDVRDQATLMEALSAPGAEIVVHLAAETGTVQSVAARCVALARKHFSLTEDVARFIARWNPPTDARACSSATTP